MRCSAGCARFSSLGRNRNTRREIPLGNADFRSWRRWSSRKRNDPSQTRIALFGGSTDLGRGACVRVSCVPLRDGRGHRVQHDLRSRDRYLRWRDINRAGILLGLRDVRRDGICESTVPQARRRSCGRQFKVRPLQIGV